MKAKTLQIVWHGKEPVFSLDFCPSIPSLLATGGADKDIKVRSSTPRCRACCVRQRKQGSGTGGLRPSQHLCAR